MGSDQRRVAITISYIVLVFFFVHHVVIISVFADICCLNLTLNGYESGTGDSISSSDPVDSV